MALSGSLYTNVGSHWKLLVEWTATQNISANTSTVTSKMYWQGLDSYSAISSSATKDGVQIIDGTTYTFSGSGLAGLSANQKKLINTTTKTITHGTDGKKTFTIDGYFDAEVTLSGVYYGRVDLTSTTFTLNDIPRASTLTSSPSWTAGNDFTLSIARASSSFTHTAKIYVNGVLLKSLTGISTSASSGFSTANHTEIFNQLNGNATEDTKIEILTYSGATQIGSTQTYTGTVTAPNSSTTTSSASFNIGNPVTVDIQRANSVFTHTVRFIVGTTTIHTDTGIGTTVTWTPTTNEITAMYNATPNSATATSKIEIDTFYGAEKVRTTTTKTGTATVTGSNPIFGTGYIYSDTNEQTVAITNNSSQIIQNKSTVRVTIPLDQRAVAQNGATMVNYIATLGGIQQTGIYSNIADVILDFGTISASGDQTLSIKAVDSRGKSTTTTKTVTMIPYSNPTVNATSKRVNGFENNTVLTMNGEYSLVTIGTIDKNAIQSVKYRYKETTVETAPTWDTWSNFVYTTTGDIYTATNIILDLDNTKSYHVEFMVTDVFGDIVVSQTVATGIPILFIASDNKKVSINQFPDPLGKALQVTGGIEVTDTITSDSTITGKKLVAQHTGGQYLSLNDGSYVAGTTGMYNYMGFNDGAGLYQAYLGFGSARDNIFNVYNKIGDVNITSTVGNIKLTPVGSGIVDVRSNLNMNNFNLVDVNHIQIKDIGNGEGLEWLSPSGLNNWKIVVTDDGNTGNSDSSAYPLQFFRNNVRMMTLGTTGTLYATNGLLAQGGKITGELVHSGDYLIMNPYDSSYGTGTGRIWYNSTANQYNFVNSSNTLSNIKCSGASTTSDRALKTNIIKDETSALDKIKATPVYDYHLIQDLEIFEEKEKGKPIKIGDKDPTKVKKKKGVMWDEAPEEIKDDDGMYKTIDLYGMNSLMWKAIQEQQEQIEDLKKQIAKK